MAILKIARMGHPVLSEPAQPVADPRAPEIRALIEDMAETMRDAPGIGLAAPQVHVPLRIVIFDVPQERGEKAEGPDRVPPGLNVLINPVIDPLDEDMEEDWEGCLSVPGLRGVVPRYAHLRYEGFDPAGRPIRRDVAGFHARVVQHECDHLLGILYPMRMRDPSRFGFTDIIFPDSGPDVD